MPQKTVFIRDADLDKWNSIEKKSEFLHNALNQDIGKTIFKPKYRDLDNLKPDTTTTHKTYFKSTKKDNK